MASIVRLHDVKDGDFKLNDIIEVVGIVSLEPTLAVPEGDGKLSLASTSFSCPHTSYSMCFPSHILLTSSGPFPPLHKVANVELLTILSTCILGDKLAAKYLMLHLISKVYLRKDILVLGKLSPNLQRMTTHKEWPMVSSKSKVRQD